MEAICLYLLCILAQIWPNYLFLGAIRSHGLLACSFLPIRLAIPIVAAVLLSPSVQLPDTIVMDSFVDYVSSYGSGILHEPVDISQTNQMSYKQHLQAQLVDILSRLGCQCSI